MDEYQYYMVRVRFAYHAPADTALEPLNGIVEELGTGEKRAFASSPELVQLLTTWTQPSANMQPAPPLGNAAGRPP